MIDDDYTGLDRRSEDRRHSDKKASGRRADDARRHEDQHHAVDLEDKIEAAISRFLSVPVAEHQLQHEYLRVVLKHEADRADSRAALRKAIIEKSLAGLIWASIVFTSQRLFPPIWHRLVSFFTEHWK